MRGYDSDRNDVLTMNIYNLPPDLTYGCVLKRNLFRQNRITCTILGVPRQSGTYRVDISVFDNRGGYASKSLSLNVRKNRRFYDPIINSAIVRNFMGRFRRD